MCGGGGIGTSLGQLSVWGGLGCLCVQRDCGGLRGRVTLGGN